MRRPDRSQLLTGATALGAGGLVALSMPPWRWLALPCALTAAEVLRLSFPFGGVPLATLAISQVSGPLAPLARLGGTILLTFVTAFMGTNLRRALRFVQSRPMPALRDVRAP